MKMKQIVVILFVVLALTFPAKTSAMSAGMGPDLYISGNASIPISIRASVEYLWGESNEYVYDTDTGDKISELDWELENIAMLGGVVSVGLVDWLQLNFGGWAAVTDGSGTMVDKDWTPALSSEWDNYSIGPVKLDHGYMVDANMAFPIEITSNLKISPMLGFKFDNWKWHDKGGKYIYSVNGWRDEKGTFPDVVGIRYEQWFYAPYLGLNMQTNYESFFFNAYIKGTLWAWSKGKDEHLNRDLLFEDKVYHQAFISAGIEAGYNVSDWCFITLGFDYQEFMTAKGSTLSTDTETGETERFDGDAAGTGHHSSVINLAVGIRF
ncbi:MAG: omptin family outer membrane protease [Pedobacter sp.]